MSTAASSSTPTVIAQRYELQRQLAQGGMAEVWLAVDLTLDRKVAVKWLKPNLATDEVVTERFRREAIAAASLNHPNIVAVHDVFEQDGRQAVVMQLVEGKSLRQLLDTQKRLSPELTCHIGTCVALGARPRPRGRLRPPRREARQHHDHVRRPCPADRLRDRQGPAVARCRSDQRQHHDGHGEVPLTRAGARQEARRPRRPVLARARALRMPRRDGCRSSARPTPTRRSPGCSAIPTDLARLRATLPTALVTIIHQLLARNPANRPATGAELVEALRTAAAEGPPVGRRHDHRAVTGHPVRPALPSRPVRRDRAPAAALRPARLRQPAAAPRRRRSPKSTPATNDSTPRPSRWSAPSPAR